MLLFIASDASKNKEAFPVIPNTCSLPCNSLCVFLWYSIKAMLWPSQFKEQVNLKLNGDVLSSYWCPTEIMPTWGGSSPAT